MKNKIDLEDIVIIGAGGLAKEIAFLIDDINKQKKIWNLLGYIDNDEQTIGKMHGKYPIFNTDDWLAITDKEINIAFGVGYPRLKQKLAKRLQKRENLTFPNLIHPSAVGDWKRIKFGIGNTVCAGNVFTTDIAINSFNLFNLSCTIGHDVTIGNFNVINPSVNISGGIDIGNSVIVGTGAQILEQLEIGSNVTIGAGAVVTKNVASDTIVVGIPAKPTE